jgi:hypothetical protein
MEDELLQFISTRCAQIISDTLGGESLNKMTEEEIEKCVNGYTIGMFSDIHQMHVLFYL